MTQCRYASDSFQNNRDAILALKRPPLNQLLDVKSRVSNLEGIADFQEKINPLNVALADNLNLAMLKIEVRIMEVLDQNQEKAAADLSLLKQDYDHR